MVEVHSYKELIVWQKAMDLVVVIYEYTKEFPQSELYGLTSQMRRAAVSIPSNIAEGRRRGTRPDYRQFLIVAYASGAELETQLEITDRLSFGNPKQRTKAATLLQEVMKMLNAMISNFSASPKKLIS